jgi:hypothetical protein
MSTHIPSKFIKLPNLDHDISKISMLKTLIDYFKLVQTKGIYKLKTNHTISRHGKYYIMIPTKWPTFLMTTAPQGVKHWHHDLHHVELHYSNVILQVYPT